MVIERVTKLGLVLAGISFWFFCCSEQYSPPHYEKGSKEYVFFKRLADSLLVHQVDPDRSEELVHTTRFSVYSDDILYILYRPLSSQKNFWQTITREKMLKYVREVAQKEAESRIFVSAAREAGIEVPEDSLQAALEQLYQKYHGKENFLAYIRRRGYSLDFVKEDIRRNYLRQRYLMEKVFPKIRVTEEEIVSYYNQDKLATVRHILLKTEGKSAEEKKRIRKRMEQLLQRARSGEDFARLARRYSEDEGTKKDGGLLRSFPRGRMVKPFEEAAFSLPIGSISDIIETKYGYHIIKVINRFKEQRPLKEARKDIFNYLMGEKKRQAVAVLLDSLKNRYHYEERFKK